MSDKWLHIQRAEVRDRSRAQREETARQVEQRAQQGRQQGSKN